MDEQHPRDLAEELGGAIEDSGSVMPKPSRDELAEDMAEVVRTGAETPEPSETDPEETVPPTGDDQLAVVTE